jgi:hypothetical protein
MFDLLQRNAPECQHRRKTESQHDEHVTFETLTRGAQAVTSKQNMTSLTTAASNEPPTQTLWIGNMSSIMPTPQALEQVFAERGFRVLCIKLLVVKRCAFVTLESIEAAVRARSEIAAALPEWRVRFAPTPANSPPFADDAVATMEIDI